MKFETCDKRMLWSIFYFHRTIYKSAEIFYSYHKVCAFDARSPWTWERSNVSRLNSFLKSYLWYLIFIKTFTIASARKHCLFSTFFSCFFFILLNNIIAPLPQSIHTRKVKTILTRVTVKAVARNSRKLWKKKKRMKRMARTVAYITSVLLLCNSILIATSLADIVIENDAF